MELIENLLQLLTTFVGALLSGIAYRKSRRQAYFLLLCFYGCFALGALYWTLYLLLFDTTPRVFYVSEFGWVASVIFLRILQATLAGSGRAQLPLPQGVARACVRRAAAGVLLHLRGHSLQPDLVRHDDMALLLRHSWACLCENADGRGAEYAVLPHRRAVLCVRGVSALDGGLLLAGYLTGKPHLLVRYAADACDSGAAARHEKGGGRMTYIENIFLCMVSPAAGGRPVHGQAAAPLLPVLHCRDGGVPAFGLYQHLPRGGMSGGRPCRHGGDRAGGGGNDEAAAAGVLSSGV